MISLCPLIVTDGQVVAIEFCIVILLTCAHTHTLAVDGKATPDEIDMIWVSFVFR